MRQERGARSAQSLTVAESSPRRVRSPPQPLSTAPGPDGRTTQANSLRPGRLKCIEQPRMLERPSTRRYRELLDTLIMLRILIEPLRVRTTAHIFSWEGA